MVTRAEPDTSDVANVAIGLKSQSIIGLESKRLNQLAIDSTIDSLYLL